MALSRYPSYLNNRRLVPHGLFVIAAEHFDQLHFISSFRVEQHFPILK